MSASDRESPQITGRSGTRWARTSHLQWQADLDRRACGRRSQKLVLTRDIILLRVFELIELHRKETR